MNDAVARDPYPSRTGAPPRLSERLDPVVHGPARGALTPEQRAQFDHAGYLQLPSFIGAASSRALLEELQALASEQRGARVILEPETEVVRSVFEVHLQSSHLLRLIGESRLLPIVRELLGGDVYVHQSRVNFKPAFDGREFYWHSDFETWHVEDGMPRMRAASLSLALTENNAFNGPLMMIPGSHRHYASCPGITPPDHYQQSLRRQEYGVPTREQLAWLVDAGGIVSDTGPAGSAVLFDCNVMHGSFANITPWARCNVFLVFNSVDNSLGAPFSGQPPRPGYIASRNAQPLSVP